MIMQATSYQGFEYARGLQVTCYEDCENARKLLVQPKMVDHVLATFNIIPMTLDDSVSYQQIGER